MAEEFNRDDWYTLEEVNEAVRGLHFPDLERLKGLYVKPKKFNDVMYWNKAEVKEWARKATAPKEQ